MTVREVEERGGRRVHRVAVVQHDRGLRREHRDEPVPHHPTAGREVEDPIAFLHVAVQLLLTEVLQQQPTGAMDDALRGTGRTGRVEDHGRVVERRAHVLEHDPAARREFGE